MAGGEPSPLELVITCRSTLARDGLAALLVPLADVRSADSVAPERLADALAAQRVDAVVLILLLEPGSGSTLSDVARLVRATRPSPALVVIAPHRNGLVRTLLQQGPPRVAFLSDSNVPDAGTLARITRDVMAGIVAIDHRALAGDAELSQVHGSELLTPREYEVLTALAEGLSNAAIASRLHLSVKSVEANITSVFRKLGLEDTGRYDRRVKAARLFSG